MRIAFALLALAALGACGFRPLYAEGPEGQRGAIGAVTIDQIAGRSGFVLKTELEQLLSVETGDDPPKRLAIQLTENFARVGLRVDEASNRADLILTANYILYDDMGKVLARGRADSVASYNVPASSFGEVAAENDARERAAELLAERIRAELALRLAQRR